MAAADRGGRDEGRGPPKVIAGIVPHHAAPIRERRLDAQTEEAKSGDEEEVGAEAQAELRDQRRQRIGQDLATIIQDAFAAKPGRLEIVHDDDVPRRRGSGGKRGWNRGCDGDDKHRDEVPSTDSTTSAKISVGIAITGRRSADKQHVDQPPATAAVKPSVRRSEASDRRDQGDDMVMRAAVDQAREHIAAEIVGAEPALALGGSPDIADDLGFAVWRDPRSGKHEQQYRRQG